VDGQALNDLDRSFDGFGERVPIRVGSAIGQQAHTWAGEAAISIDVSIFFIGRLCCIAL
jgi:hypothetical protein